MSENATNDRRLKFALTRTNRTTKLFQKKKPSL